MPPVYLAINCGSSSIKCAVVDPQRGLRLHEAVSEEPGSAQALTHLIARMTQAAGAATPVEAVVHRIVHGGSSFSGPVLVDADVERKLESLAQLAPLHNPPALEALRVARDILPSIPHVLCFDTAFHRTLPRRASSYALPVDRMPSGLDLRRHGFHGLSHAHVMRATARFLGSAPSALRIVSCHLGSGASTCAIEYGSSTETSMGMTPLEGLVMATRAGDLDPGILLELQRAGWDVQAIGNLLHRESGLLALAGTADMREIEGRAALGHEGCRLALAVFAHRVRKYIGAYVATMGGVDAIVFTGGIGEHSATVRHRCLQRLDFLGAVLDEDRNRDAQVTPEAPVVEISDERSRVKLLVIAANEELEMALQARRLLHPQPESRVAIRVAVSARHAHLTQQTIDQLFGTGYVLHPQVPLHQPGQFASQETVTLVGPKGRLEGVRLIGPPRAHDQIEVSRSDEFTLGVDAPVRLSGDLHDSPGIAIEGPCGRAQLSSGVICARRHVHLNAAEAARLGVADGDRVSVRVPAGDRHLVFEDVHLRVAGDFALELHLDTDEANAAGLRTGDSVELLLGHERRG